MRERVPLARFMPYGAPDLMVAARPDLARALLLASVATALLFALLGLAQLAHPTPATAPRTAVYDVVLPPAPPIEPMLIPTVPLIPQSGGAGSTIGKVVPDEQAPTEVTFVMPDEIGTPGIGDPDGAADLVRIDPVPAETLPVFGEWRPVEKLPESIRTVKPDYPDIARTALVEGWVVVHLLVGRDGRIVEVRLDGRQHVPMLDSAALDAARRFAFQPATANGRAVAAWVTVPFHFTLH